MLISAPKTDILNRSEASLEVIQKIKRNQYRKNTQIGYGSDIKDLNNYLANIGHELNLKLPHSLLEEYLVYLAAKGYKITTIKRRVASIRAWYKNQGSEAGKFNEIIKGLENTLLEKENYEQLYKRQAPSFTIDNLLIECNKLSDLGTFKALRDRLILLLGTSCALRASELISLKKKQFKSHENGYKLVLFRSKNLSVGETGEKWIPQSETKVISPADALEEYFEKFNVQDNDFLFKAFGRGDHQKNNMIDYITVNRLLKYHFGDNYSSHSMRASFVTEAFNKGATVADVIKQTHHKSANSLMLYLRSNKISENNAVNRIF